MSARKKKTASLSRQHGAPIAPLSFEDRGITIDEWIQEKHTTQQDYALRSLLRLFVGCVFLTFLLIFLKAFDSISLSHEFMMWLGGVTVAEVAGMVVMIIRRLWR